MHRAMAIVLLLGMPAAAETMPVSAADCRQLVAHAPAPDVTYKPGVDVRGNAVAPADLGAGYALALPDEITIDIGIDLADRLGRTRARQNGVPATTANRPLRPFTGTAPVGMVTVKDG